MSTPLRIFSTGLLALCLFVAAPLPALAADPASAPYPGADWQLSTPEAQGMDSAALAGLYEYLASAGFNTDSVLVVRHGRIVSETYVPPYRAGLRHDLRSVTKSVVSTLVGAAIQEGKLQGTQQKALEFFPDRAPNSPAQAALSVQNLLDMATGIAWREWPYNADSDAYKLWGSEDWVRFILERPVAEPGSQFKYIAAAPHLLSAILTRATGQSAAEYGRRKLFATLGISDFSWHADPQGNSVGESSLRLKPRDMAKLGYLLLRNGRWGDQQMLPPDWTDAVLSQGLPNGLGSTSAPPAYSRLWWTDSSVPYAAAEGRHGQHIIVLPRHDVVLVVTSKAWDNSYRARAPEMVKRHLLPAIRGDQALPEDPAAQQRLARAIAGLVAKSRGIESAQASQAARSLAGRRFTLATNPGGYREFELTLDGPQPGYLLLQADKTSLFGVARRGGPIALDGQYAFTGLSGASRWARRGRWVDESTFRIETQQLESAIVAEWTLHFHEGKLAITYADGDGVTFKLQGTPQE
ncbi:MAG TPA: serine hydrolase [Burkholderiaceae bacterium]|nr:serine hydrolase [Burkholderiaceae bacterium]